MTEYNENQPALIEEAPKVVTMSDFLKANRKDTTKEKEVYVSEFSAPFKVRSLTETQNEVLKKGATLKVRNKSGVLVDDLNVQKYQDAMLVACVVSPDLKNAELQASYGTMGSAIETLKAMLLPGSYAKISEAIMEVNGFGDSEDLETLRDEVKK